MSEDHLAADLFAAHRRALGGADRPLSTMSPRIRRQYARFADEVRPLLEPDRAIVGLARAAEADVSFVIEAIEAWEDGADPGDTLRAIRDQLAGKTPGDADD